MLIAVTGMVQRVRGINMMLKQAISICLCIFISTLTLTACSKEDGQSVSKEEWKEKNTDKRDWDSAKGKGY